MFDYIAYTDGACKGTRNGGWGCVLFKKENMEPQLFLEGYSRTTNNRMELMAIIHALRNVPLKSSILIHSDSMYCLEPIKTGQINFWRARRFAGVKNSDLWLKIWALLQGRQVSCHWVKGHNGDYWNEIADALACAGAYMIDLKEDL